MNNEFDWQELLRRALAGGLGSQNFGNEQGPTTNSSVNLGDWTAQLDPTRGGYLFSRQQGDNPDTTQVFSVDQSGQQTGDPWSHTSQGQGIGSILGEFGKIAAPFALMALGGNYLSGLGGDAAAGLGGASAEGMGAGGGALGDAAAGAAGGGTAGGGATWGGMAGATGGLTPAALEASLGTAGYGAAGTAGGTALGISGALNGAGAGLPFAGAAGGAAAGGGLLSSLGSAAGIGQALAPILGAVAGSQSTPGQQVTNQKTLDPRIDAMVFGKDGAGGLLSDASSWYQANKSGQNDTMRQANSQLTGLLTDPRVMQGLYTQGGAGLGMMQGGVAANPFSRQGFNGSNWWG